MGLRPEMNDEKRSAIESLRVFFQRPAPEAISLAEG